MHSLKIIDTLQKKNQFYSNKNLGLSHKRLSHDQSAAYSSPGKSNRRNGKIILDPLDHDRFRASAVSHGNLERNNNSSALKQVNPYTGGSYADIKQVQKSRHEKTIAAKQ